MSSHSSFADWKPGDELTEEFIQDTARCVCENRQMGIHAFAIMCHADRLIWGMTLCDEPPPEDNPWYPAYEAVTKAIEQHLEVNEIVEV